MSNRRLIRHSAGVLLTLLLLATLIVPAANAQVVANPVAGTGALQGVVVDANTREPLVEVINIISVGGVCPGGIVSLNPLTSVTGLTADVVGAIPPPAAAGVNNLACTSLSSNIGRWGFTNVPAGAPVTVVPLPKPARAALRLRSVTTPPVVTCDELLLRFM